MAFGCTTSEPVEETRKCSSSPDGAATAPPSSRSSITSLRRTPWRRSTCAAAARAIAYRTATRSRNSADDVTGFCRTVGIERPIVVGHSLGGMIAVELAGRRPSLPRALVLVDPGPIDWDPEMCRRFDALAKQLAGPGGEEIRRRYVENMGAHDPALALSIADMMSAIPLPIATAVIQHLTAWDGAGAMARCDVPTLLLRTELDAEDLRLLEIKPDLTVGVTVGAGHFHQLEVPDQVNAMIDRFLELTGSLRAGPTTNSA